MSPYSSGWGNNELQCYTEDPDNIRVEANPERAGDGVLFIDALYEQGYRCKSGPGRPSSRDFTSGRLITKDKNSFQWSGTVDGPLPLYIEARIKTPSSKCCVAVAILPFVASSSVDKVSQICICRCTLRPCSHVIARHDFEKHFIHSW